MNKTNLFISGMVFLGVGIFAGFKIAENSIFILDGGKGDIEENTIVITAEGAAEWFIDQKESIDSLTLETVKTDPKDGRVYFASNKDKISGKIELKLTDLVPLDNTSSQDKAEGYASFESPEGDNFRVVLTGVMPATHPLQSFGGVVTNTLMNGNTGIAQEGIPVEFAYVAVFGSGDIYKKSKLIASDQMLYISATQVSPALNEDLLNKKYNFEDPVGPLIIHLLVLPWKLSPDNTIETKLVPIGVVGTNGKEQGIFHINFIENIEIVGNKFFDNKLWMNL